MVELTNLVIYKFFVHLATPLKQNDVQNKIGNLHLTKLILVVQKWNYVQKENEVVAFKLKFKLKLKTFGFPRVGKKRKKQRTVALLNNPI